MEPFETLITDTVFGKMEIRRVARHQRPSDIYEFCNNGEQKLQWVATHWHAKMLDGKYNGWSGDGDIRQAASTELMLKIAGKYGWKVGARENCHHNAK